MPGIFELKNLFALSMKILITSDNHLGFKETDPVRAEDSFNTFDEILSLARQERADLILQGGDLFHENKPSRNTYNKTLQILKKYCLGEAKPTFTSSTPLNFNNPNINISLPILSIHGNHDDPSGFNSISPLDILQSGGLINYFGKVDNVDNIELQPILIEKDRKVAVFGLGYIKDRRLYKTFLKGNVKYKRPAGEDWFNILMVHQNRVPREGEYLPEDLIDPFFDLVIYGHEHESIKIRHKNFDVIQCGSSIRTSLCEGESFDKYAYILEFFEKPHIRRVALKTVRPLVIENMRIVSGAPEMQVRSKIEEMLCKARYNAIDDNFQLPLMRLRVELEGSPDFNRHKIFPLLEEKVANPSDSLRVIRKIEKKPRSLVSTTQKSEIEDIYKEILQSFNLKTLIQYRVIDSLKDFVEKDSKEAFTSLIQESVARIVDSIDFEGVMADNIEDVIKTARESLLRKDNIEESDESSFKIPEDDAEYPSENKHVNTLHLESFCKTVPLPEEPSSLCANTSALCSKETEDYTFIEEKQENKEKHELILKIKGENTMSCNGDITDLNAKKQKIKDSSDDDIFIFAKYL